MKNYILPIIAAAFLIFAGYHLVRSQQPRVETQPPHSPAASPFEHQVAGLGIVEARTENIAIGSPLPGVVIAVMVQEGDRVRAGQPLFRLDTRQAEAETSVRRTMLSSAQAQLARLDSMPRSEELPSLAAQVAEMEALVKQKDDALARSKRLQHSGAVTEQTMVQDQQALEVAKAQLARMVAQDQLVKAGAWQPEKEVARAAVAQAQAQLQQAETELDRHQIAAPESVESGDATTEWEVLKVNVRPGEFVGTPPGQPLIVLGDTRARHVRVDIDENDISRFQPAAQATAFVRGDNQKEYDLTFVRVQPYVVPKKSLSGDNAERVDTRVLQVLYRVEDEDRDIFIGQQMDVFLKVSEATRETSGKLARAER